MSKTPHTFAGSSPTMANQRRAAFPDALLAHNGNAKAAAISLGYSPVAASVEASRLLKEPGVQAALAVRAEAVAKKAKLRTDRWAKHLAALAFSDVADLYDVDGNLLPVHLLPPDTKRAISSIKVTERDGSRTTEVKFWDKNAALATVAKHLGLFERDNAQQRPDVRVNVVLVG